MDLLVYLIHKNEVDIYDIPIARVTEQYMSFLDAMVIPDMDLASDFLVMAATLLEIKSPGAIPLWLCHVLSGLEIYPVSFSKVGRSYQAMLLDPHQNKEGEKRYA